MFNFNNEMMDGSLMMTHKRSWEEDRPMPLSIDCNVGILSPRADFMINNNSNLPKAPKMRRIESRSEGQLSPCLNMRFNEDRLNMPLIRESSQDSSSSLFRGSSHYSEIKVVNERQLQLPMKP